MTGRGVMGWLAGAFVIAGIVVWAWWPVYQAASRATATTSLRDAWQGRSLTFRPDGCVELVTEKGHRAFVFEKKAWRECPRAKTR